MVSQKISRCPVAISKGFIEKIAIVEHLKPDDAETKASSGERCLDSFADDVLGKLSVGHTYSLIKIIVFTRTILLVWAI